MDYAELYCLSNYSFLKATSYPEELVEAAIQQDYRALAITDECSLSGVVRAHVAVKNSDSNLKLIVGSMFILDDDLKIVVMAKNREAYAQLCKLITAGRRVAKKGEYYLTRKDIESHVLNDCLFLWVPNKEKYSVLSIATPSCINKSLQDEFIHELTWVKNTFSDRVWLAVELHLQQFMSEWLSMMLSISRQHGLRACASGGVCMHHPKRRMVYDLLTAIDRNCVLSKLDCHNQINAQHHMRSAEMLSKLYPQKLLSETVAIAERCHFNLDELRYEYPNELVPKGWTAIRWLQHLTEEGMQRRWPGSDGTPAKVMRLVKHELALIQELKYEPYFLTVYDLVRYARSQNILCQGRGSAANSAVCYCLGITEVDPARMNLLFERFVSKERNEPPDIDVDFEHERREEVIQYIYTKYGRHRAAIAATIICYQPRSAIRDVGKALGFNLDQVNRLAKSWQWWDGHELIFDETQTGLDHNSRAMRQLKYLVGLLIGFPRHLSQHVGGFIIAADDLSRLVPCENAAMKDRTVIQWEKNDLEALGLLKIDVLSLGMLTAIRKTLQMISLKKGYDFKMSDIPSEDVDVYRMIQQADTLGVFQIESRAQMSMLPRLRPENYYDLVVQVAIVRPGPIQGDMVHPYLSRRQGLEEVSYPSEQVKEVLKRTLGVPIFQEQVMQLAMVAAGFSAGEADQLRRGMAAWKRKGGLKQFESRLCEGMLQRGYTEKFAKQIFSQIQGFGEYGFPESHAASFALLAYVSAWLKHYYPAEFCCALLNSQPMGFYAPAQLVQDAQRHGVKVNPVDINISRYDCCIENNIESDDGNNSSNNASLRLGLRMVKGLSMNGIKYIENFRPTKGYASIQELVNLSNINKKDLEALAAADALQAIAGNRYKAYWQASGVEEVLPLYKDISPVQDGVSVMLPVPTEGQQIIKDYASLSLSLRKHPLELLRKKLDAKRVCVADKLKDRKHNSKVVTAGLVINRQRPSTSKGVIFMTLEDETGYSNIIVWASFAEAQRKVLLNSQLLAVHGTIQNKEGVVYVAAGRLEDLTSWIGDLQTNSRDFH